MPRHGLRFESGTRFYQRKTYWSANNSFNHRTLFVMWISLLAPWKLSCGLTQKQLFIQISSFNCEVLWVNKPQMRIQTISRVHMFSQWQVQFYQPSHTLIFLFCSAAVFRCRPLQVLKWLIRLWLDECDLTTWKYTEDRLWSDWPNHLWRKRVVSLPSTIQKVSIWICIPNMTSCHPAPITPFGGRVCTVAILGCSRGIESQAIMKYNNNDISAHFYTNK